ncbi:hypothetical protein ACHAXR_012872 [Thalassiosira sp. AJA248-18]
MTKPSPLTVLLLAAIAIFQSSYASAFLPSPSITRAAGRRPHSPIPSSAQIIVTSSLINSSPSNTQLHPFSSSRTTRSSSSSQLHSFFGLGPAELIIIAIAGVIFIGPSKLLQFSKEAGEVAGKTGTSMGSEWSELKAIPEEFQKGVEEGEIEARSRKAKVMDGVGEEKKE